MHAAFIAGDWGTSRLRLSLCDTAGGVLESRDEPGIHASRGRVEDVFFEQTAPWSGHGALPVLLCGMAGSTIGWRAAPYLPCPVAPQAIAEKLLRFEARGRTIAIAPGLSCTNPLGAPDVMRGEETQILGALGIAPALRRDRQILCLPGTHTKWVLLADGVIAHFLTAVSGELFDTLHRHSVLTGGAEGDTVSDQPFMRALEQTRASGGGDLIHRLFEVRSRQLSGELTADEARAYLSGLIIGQDVAGALRLLGVEKGHGVTIIAAPRLGALYDAACRAHGIRTAQIDGDAAARSGLAALYESTREQAGHGG